MNGPEISKEELENFKKAALSSGEMIEQSSTFLAMFTKNYASDPIALIQFAIAVNLDKPILLLVEEGTPIPQHVRAIASGIEFFKRGESDSLKSATERIAVKIHEAPALNLTAVCALRNLVDSMRDFEEIESLIMSEGLVDEEAETEIERYKRVCSKAYLDARKVLDIIDARSGDSE